MDTRRSADSLTDAALDRELQRALAVDPSPEFVARVRTRIASEPAPRAWQFPWVMSFAGGAVVAAVIVMAIARTRPDRVSAGPAPVLTAHAIASASSSLPSAAPGRSVSSVPYVASAFRRTNSASTDSPAEAGRHVPETTPIFDPRETRALQTFIVRLRSGDVDLSPLLQPAPKPPMELPPIEDLVIQPLSIDPLAPPERAQGERQ